jgi:hypothetical protein
MRVRQSDHHRLQGYGIESLLHTITNWPQYNKSLIHHGSLTVSINAEIMNERDPP